MNSLVIGDKNAIEAPISFENLGIEVMALTGEIAVYRIQCAETEKNLCAQQPPKPTKSFLLHLDAELMRPFVKSS